MITHWDVVSNVALRYGSREDMFDENAQELAAVRNGKKPLLSLEKDADRVKKRIAREPTSLRMTLERINGLANFQDNNVLDKLSNRAQAVCRLLKNGSPLGTGFLVGEGILLTNHHVIENTGDADDMLAEFDYELDINQVPKDSACFRLRPDTFFLTSSLEEEANNPNSGLDFTFIGIESTSTKGKPLSKYHPVLLDGNKGKIIKGESCVIIQHPQGLTKKVVLKDTAFFSETETRIVYESDTLPGSSGALVVALGTCEVIALHHSGLPRTDEQNRVLTKAGTLATPQTSDEEIDWIGNEGIKISKIVEVLQQADLPEPMQPIRAALLRRTENVSNKLSNAIDQNDTELNTILRDMPSQSDSPGVIKQPVPPTSLSTPTLTTPTPPTTMAESNASGYFILSAVNKSEVIERIELILRAKYNREVPLTLLMPFAAREGEIELFEIQIPTSGNPDEAAQELVKIPEILNAEADDPLRLNADTSFRVPRKKTGFAESEIVYDDGFGKFNEEEFLKKYDQKSKYVKGKAAIDYRKWNWTATGFDKAISNPNTPSPKEKGIRVVQFDTGYSRHSKVEGGFDLDQDFSFLENTDDAFDPQHLGILKFPGHGTRTGSLLIGNKDLHLANDGNVGLLTPFNLKLVPYRIAETVIIINRQQQLASALDRAIAQGFDVITMSMGLPPTMATARMAKKAYEQGIIWCCAAGNQVQAVIAPAVYPGTIAVAASNPLDADWSGSCRGDTVDITAPGEDVYVPIVTKSGNVVAEDFAYGNGTSYATPHVAAAAAYWLAKYHDQLMKPEYAGWRRVEAFRQALKASGRRENQLPRKGFGHGMLDAVKLLNTSPLPANQLVNAYEGWNEQAFFSTLQGYAEIVKTYWNKLHGLFSRTQRGGQESLALGDDALSLSSRSQQLEAQLFSSSLSRFESVGTTEPAIFLERYNALQHIIETSSK